MRDPYRTLAPAGSRTRTTRVLVTWVFLITVAAFEAVGFRLSYEALHRVAVDNAVPEHSAWMFPVLVDGGIVLGSIGVIRALAAARSRKPYWTVTVGFTLVSWGFNVSAAPRTAGGWAVATVAPLAQMVALEMGMQELRALLLAQPKDAPGEPAMPSLLAPVPSMQAPVPSVVAPAQAMQALNVTPAPDAAPAAEAAPAAADSTDQRADGTQQQPDSSAQRPDSAEQQPEQQEQPAEEDRQQRPQRQRPPLPPDDSRPWAVLYEECSTEDERIALTREALSARKKLTAPQWAVDIGKGETRARDLLRAARKPATGTEAQAQLELLSA